MFNCLLTFLSYINIFLSDDVENMFCSYGIEVPRSEHNYTQVTTVPISNTLEFSFMPKNIFNGDLKYIIT